MEEREIAIVDPSTLTQIGLRSCLDPMMEGMTLRCFNSFEELIRDTPDAYSYYDVSCANTHIFRCGMIAGYQS